MVSSAYHLGRASKRDYVALNKHYFARGIQRQKCMLLLKTRLGPLVPEAQARQCRRYANQNCVATERRTAVGSALPAISRRILCIVVAACAVALSSDLIAQPAKTPPPPQRYQSDRELPDELSLDVIEGPQWKAMRAEAAKSRCGGFVYTPKAAGGSLPGKPVLAAVSQKASAGRPSGVVKLQSELWPVASEPGNVTTSDMPFVNIGFMIGPFVPVQRFADELTVRKNLDDLKDQVFIRLTSDDTRIVRTRVLCANGSGLCRRYAGHFAAHWFDYKVGRVKPVRLSTRELVIEDRCPHTRAAMIEFYASKLGAMESFHRMTNP